MPDSPLPPTTRLAVIREVFAGLLSLTVMMLFLILMVRALGRVSGNEFQPIKDLLAIVNPTVGVIIGYYFSRVTSEARAENAEASAATAGRTAMDHSQARAQSDLAAQQAHQQAAQAKAALSELVQAADGITSSATASGLEGRFAEPAGDSLLAARARLEMAVERAKRAMAS